MKVNNIYHGNNLEVLKMFEDNSIDSIVTDPPYGINFMNKKWDYDVPSVELWKECLRVLKPGGHILVACGTRTQHRMAVNIEDGGFEIRDIVAWVYASGFPKSLNIEKTLKKHFKRGNMDVGDNNEKNRNEWKISNKQKTKHNVRLMWKTNLPQTINVDEKQGKVLQQSVQKQSIQIPINTTNNVWKRQSIMEGRSNIQKTKRKLQRRKICEMPSEISTNGTQGRLYNGTQTCDGKTFEKIVKKNGSRSSCESQSERQQNRKSDAIQKQQKAQENRIVNKKDVLLKWQGWGTALKPAMELWTLARKPIEGTVAENVLKYGVGGINIDECRVNFISEEDKGNPLRFQTENGSGSHGVFNASKDVTSVVGEKGRWPANLIHDGSKEVVDMFPNTEAGGSINKTYEDNSPLYGDYGVKPPFESYGDSGSASRFFYVPKASQEERNFGLYDFDNKFTASAEFRPNHMEKAIKGENGNPYGRWNPRKNIHPTVKPVELMRYLTRMITPPNGICLDPYVGSGTTAMACKIEGFRYIGIECEKDYVDIANARLNAIKEDYDSTLDTTIIIKEAIKEDKEKEQGIITIFDL